MKKKGFIFYAFIALVVFLVVKMFSRQSKGYLTDQNYATNPYSPVYGQAAGNTAGGIIAAVGGALSGLFKAGAFNGIGAGPSNASQTTQSTGSVYDYASSNGLVLI